MAGHSFGASWVCLWGLVVFAAVMPTVDAQEPISFERDIQPILQASCESCHGELHVSGLDLRTRDSALKGGDHGVAIVPGSADQSRLFRRIAGLEQPSMPKNGALTLQQISIIKTWIAQGAHGDSSSRQTGIAEPRLTDPLAVSGTNAIPAARNYWAFRLPVQTSVPDTSGFSNPIDRFLEKVRQEKGLKPAPRADRLTLV